MVMESKDKKKVNKKAGRKDLSFKGMCSVVTNTFNGLRNFFRYERSALVYLIASAFTIGAGIILQMSMMEWIMIFFVLLTMLASELLNTAIEAVCDLVSPEYNPFVNVELPDESAMGVQTKKIEIIPEKYIDIFCQTDLSRDVHGELCFRYGPALFFYVKYRSTSR